MNRSLLGFDGGNMMNGHPVNNLDTSTIDMAHVMQEMPT
jgi:hypothetical protein